MSCPFVSNTLCTWWGVSTSRCCPKVSLEAFTNRVVATTTHKQLGQPKVPWSNRLRKRQLALGCPPTSESTVLKLSRSPRSPPGGDSPSGCCPYLGGVLRPLPCSAPHLTWLLPSYAETAAPYTPKPSRLPSSQLPPGLPWPWRETWGTGWSPRPPGDPSPCGGENGARKRKFYF